VSLVAAHFLHAFSRSLFFGVKATDALPFMAMSAILLTAAPLASKIPARRASSVDPARSLRAD
jgi:hypothetical protein